MPAARRPTTEDIPGLIDDVAAGMSLHAACNIRGIHSGHTLALMRSDDRHWANYVRARAIRGDEQAHRVADIVNGMLLGDVPPDVGRAAIDGLKWTAGRMAPRLWGDKTQHEHMGEGGGPVLYANLTSEQRKARIAELEAKKRAEADDADDG